MNPENDSIQSNLFDASHSQKLPLREILRPKKIEEVFGNQRSLKSIINISKIPGRHIIIYGPPGIGKTTTCDILASKQNAYRLQYQPAIETLSTLKKLIGSLESLCTNKNRKNVLFIDEIHRLDKKQQDFLLPYLEKGIFQLFGATTETPHVFLGPAMLSRINVFKFKTLNNLDQLSLLDKAIQYLKIDLTPEQRQLIVTMANGDGRKIVQLIERFHATNLMNHNITINELIKIIGEENSQTAYDRRRHYDLLSALIKSMRSSEVDEAILWLACMIEEGSDIESICRRLIIFASEDVGNAAPNALTLATSAHQAVKNIGLPEAKIIMSQTVIYLAKAPKSKAAYEAIKNASKYVTNHKNIEVPLWRKNTPNQSKVLHKTKNYPKFYHSN